MHSSSIISTLLDMVPSVLSLPFDSQKIGISHKTVESYLETFQDLFISKVMFCKTDGVVFRKEKKIMFRDPFIIRSLSFWCGRDVRKDFIYENVVQEHLLEEIREVKERILFMGLQRCSKDGIC